MLPDWIYEPLPYVYAIAGIVAFWNLDALLGEVSGLLLISAGLVIGSMRYEYRKSRKAQAARAHRHRK